MSISESINEELFNEIEMSKRFKAFKNIEEEKRLRKLNNVHCSEQWGKSD